jgi:CRP-like cAMP-binding protein
MNVSLLDSSLVDPGALRYRDFSAGEHVFSEGDRAHAVFAVETGRIKLVRFTVEGREAVIHTALEGESFAEASLFSDVYHCNAVAVVPSRVAVCPREHLLRILRDDPRRAERFVALLSSQVRDLRTRLEFRSILSARERIMQYLQVMTPPGKAALILPSSLKDIAAELGLAHETFYRELSSLETDGLIAREGSTVSVLRDREI